MVIAFYFNLNNYHTMPKQNKYKRIARNMGFYPHHSNIYGECEKTGIQGAFITLIDKIESIDERLKSATILERYEIMNEFFEDMNGVLKK